VYKQVVSCKVSLHGESPELTVLSTEGSWIVLLKLRSSYKETDRSVLVTVEMLHFVRRNSTVSQEEMWDHLHEVFGYALCPLFSNFLYQVMAFFYWCGDYKLNECSANVPSMSQYI
jgi:hypothetical protein